MISDLFPINQPVSFNHSFSLKNKNVKDQINHHLYFRLFTLIFDRIVNKTRQWSRLAIWKSNSQNQNWQPKYKGWPIWFEVDIGLCKGVLTLTDMVPLDFIVYPSDSVSSKRVFVLVLIWILPGSPVLSILEAKLIVSPKRQNLGILLPITPPTALPEWIPICG